MSTEVDHLVVLADTLARGEQWCADVMGATPAGGGRHLLMGTHNRLLAIGSAAYPKAYLELLAIDPDAPPPARARWFGLDDPALKAAVRQSPRLHHLVLRTRQIETLRAGLIQQGQQPGEPIAAERDTPQGLLRWRILLRADGRIAADGALPTLIEWQGPHPADALPTSPVALAAVRLGRLPAGVSGLLRTPDAPCTATGPTLQVQLHTPRGLVALQVD